jgi:hypothetical protein
MAFALIGALGLVACNRQTATHDIEKPAASIDQAKRDAAVAQRLLEQTQSRSVYTESAKPDGKEQAITNVNSLSVHLVMPTVLIIQAAGTVPSGGWSRPMLVPVENQNSNASAQRFRFVATPPDAKDKSPSKPIYVQLRLDAVPAGLKSVQIVSAGNTLSATIVRPQFPASSALASAQTSAH